MNTFSKIVLFVVFLILFYGGFGLVLLDKLSHIANLVEKLHEHPFLIIRSVIATSNDAIAISRNVKDLALINDDLYRRNRLTEIKLYENDALQNMRHVLLLVEDDEGRELANEAISIWTDQSNLIDKLVEMIIAGEERKAEMMELEGLELMRKVEKSLTNLASYAQRWSIKYRSESNDDLRHAKIFLWAAGLIIAILSAVFAIYFYLWIYGSLRRTKKSLTMMTQDPIDLTTRLKTPSLFDLNATINTLLEKISSNLSVVTTRISEVENAVTSDNNLTKKETYAQLKPIAEGGYQALSLVMVQIKTELTTIKSAIVAKDISPSDPIHKDIDQSLKSADNAIILIEALAEQFGHLVHLHREEHEMSAAFLRQKETLSTIKESLHELKDDLSAFKI